MELKKTEDITETNDTAINETAVAAEINEEELKRKKRNGNIKFFVTLIAIVAFVILFTKFIISPISVVGSSMEPTYTSGKILFGKSRFIDPEPDYGEVVVFKNEGTDNKLFIKRLVGKPGDTLEIRNGLLYRNGEEAENFELIITGGEGILGTPYTLKEGEYMVMGDNRNNSMDSRFEKIGPIALGDIKYIILNSKIEIGE